MNILPKKSWHVRTRKNIERVRRDEAEAARLARIEQDRTMQVEQEIRIRELRSRSDPGKAVSESALEHINLFEAPEDKRQLTNKDHDDEKRQENVKSEQRAGLFNKLVRSEDANMPWYCQPKSDFNNLIGETKSSGKKRLQSNLITNIYDPMTTMRHAEEVVRVRRAERRERERLTNAGNQQPAHQYKYRDRLQFQEGSSHQQSEMRDTRQEIKDNERTTIESSNSSPEVVKIIEKVKDLVKSDKRKKHSNKKSKKHKRSSPERRHTKHRHKKHRK